jgi:hypothetical protein
LRAATKNDLCRGGEQWSEHFILANLESPPPTQRASAGLPFVKRRACWGTILESSHLMQLDAYACPDCKHWVAGIGRIVSSVSVIDTKGQPDIVRDT